MVPGRERPRAGALPCSRQRARRRGRRNAPVYTPGCSGESDNLGDSAGPSTVASAATGAGPEDPSSPPQACPRPAGVSAGIRPMASSPTGNPDLVAGEVEFGPEPERAVRLPGVGSRGARVRGQSSRRPAMTIDELGVGHASQLFNLRAFIGKDLRRRAWRGCGPFAGPGPGKGRSRVESAPMLTPSSKDERDRAHVAAGQQLANPSRRRAASPSLSRHRASLDPSRLRRAGGCTRTAPRQNSAACCSAPRPSWSGLNQIRPAVYRVAWSLSNAASGRLRRRPLV